jgi:hypothetical protein
MEEIGKLGIVVEEGEERSVDEFEEFDGRPECKPEEFVIEN